MNLWIVLVGTGAAVFVGLLFRLALARQPQLASVPSVPTNLSRDDFPHVDRDWLVVSFVSTDCDSCSRVADVVRPLESADVAIALVFRDHDKELHDKYQIEAVPTTLIVDADGGVRQFFLGAPTAADLWAAVAEVREPGSTPRDECSNA